MATELYILKIRIISALRWIAELGFIRIIFLIGAAAALIKYLWDANNSVQGIIAVILLNAGVIFSVHSSRKDDFFLSSIDVKKKTLYALEYFLYSLPFIIILLASQYFYFAGYNIIVLAVIVNIKSGRRLLLTFKTGKSFFPPYAFEWKSGLRVNFFPIAIIYLFGIIFCFTSAAGILAIIVLTLIFSSFFIQNEPILYIEAYRISPEKFLRVKIIQSLKIYLLITLPIAISHLIFFYERWYLMAGTVSLCSIILSVSIITKYAFYAEEITDSRMNYIISSVIIFSFVSSFFMTGPFLFPVPFLLSVYLYRKASQNLRKIRFIAMQ